MAAASLQVVDWTRQLYTGVMPFVAPAVYVNYLDRDLCSSPVAPWTQLYYGANYDRLVSIKQQYDPHNVFMWPQAVGGPCAPVVA